MRKIVDILFFITIIFLLFVFITKIGILGLIINKTGSSIPNIIGTSSINESVNASNLTTIPIQKINQTALDFYALGLINNDRSKFGLPPVSLSNISSAQQHAESMLEYNYFSHWDLFDMKPYMRYTLLGGNQSVQENIAYEESTSCGALGCFGNINVTNALYNMEYSMMYNDSICCNNGHRDNILNPYHNQVSIGVAYNASTVYFVEDFINDYISWSPNSPSYSNNGEVYLLGNTSNNLSFYGAYVSYDPLLVNLTRSNVPKTPYSFGNEIAGVVNNSNEYYQNISTIVADNYYINKNIFKVSFNIKKIIKTYGPGEYTILLLVKNDSTGNTFMASDYTIFINSTGSEYLPKNI